MCDNIEDRPFRILAIDGGGIRGIIPAKGLAMVEDQLEKEGKSPRICDYFDLICGTSTGAILAIALALGVRAQELLNLYVNHAKEIFPYQNTVKKLALGLVNNPIYDRTKLGKLIEETYGSAVDSDTARIGHCKTRICVPTYDVFKGEMHVFKTSHHKELEIDYNIPAYHIALASAAAPIYFDSYSFDCIKKSTNEKKTYRYNVDGGIMANNPTLIGYVEAVRTLGISPENLQILSLGTGSTPYADNRDCLKMGGRYWITNKNSFLAVYDLFSSAQSIYVDNIMKFLNEGIGPDNKHVFTYERIQHKFLDAKGIAMDKSDESSLQKLVSIGEKLFHDKTENIIVTFCGCVKQDFIPVHKL